MTVSIRECFMCAIACEADVPCPRCGGIDGITRRYDDADYERFGAELAKRVVDDIESRLRALVDSGANMRGIVEATVFRHFVSMMGHAEDKPRPSA